MSILSAFYHNETHDYPNKTHNSPAGPLPEVVPSQVPGGPIVTPGIQLNSVSSARGNFRALLDGHMRPALHYTQQEARPNLDGWEETPHTVASKLESKEEYPQG